MWHAEIHASRNLPGEFQSVEARISFECDGGLERATGRALELAKDRWSERRKYERHFVREIYYRSEG